MFNDRLKKHLLAVVAICAMGSVGAQPSIYYKFQHKITKAVVCETEAPDAKLWVQIAGPFSDANCQFKEPG